ncbi:MAG: hypothetical protein ACOCUH_00845, partial [Bacteriovoracia bacterium]
LFQLLALFVWGMYFYHIWKQVRIIRKGNFEHAKVVDYITNYKRMTPAGMHPLFLLKDGRQVIGINHKDLSREYLNKTLLVATDGKNALFLDNDKLLIDVAYES